MARTAQQQTPSPSAYNIQSKAIEGAKTAMHAKLQVLEKEVAPGVGTYDLLHLPNLNHKRTTKFSFGTGKRDRSPTEMEQKHKPGVGAYCMDRDMK